MASYHVRQRDPLLDEQTHIVLERRGKELLGLGLVAIAVLVAAMLLSYEPTDPSWLSATGAEAQNWLGRTGASIAAPLVVISGWGSAGLVAVLMAWGLRFVLHRGEERALNRVIFAPIAMALISVHASTLVPGPGWGHSFGLGGLFGDTVLGALLGVAPVQASLSLKLMSALSFVAAVGMVLFVCGFDARELRLTGRFLGRGLILAYAQVMALLGQGAGGAIRAAQSAREGRRDRRAAAAVAAEPAPKPAASRVRATEWASPQPMRAAEPQPRLPLRLPAAPDWEDDDDEALFDEADPVPEPAPARGGLLSRMPGFRRAAEPDPDPELVRPLPREADAPSDDRVRARIADAVRARARQPSGLQGRRESLGPNIIGRREPPLTANRAEPPLVRPRKPMPLIADTRPRRPAAVDLAAEDLAAPAVAMAAVPAVVAAMARPEPTAPEAEWAEPAAPARRVVPRVLEEEDTDNIFALDGEGDPLPARGDAGRGAPPPAPAPAAPRAAPAPAGIARATVRPAELPSWPGYEHPPLDLLADPGLIQRQVLSEEALEENARMLESVLDDYGVKGEIVSVRPGPVVTMYELEPAPGLKASRVIGLADDIARSMSALSARVSTVPGRSVIGIELPNVYREKVVLREILTSRDFGDSNQRLPLALGKDIGGAPIVANLAKMPHLLIAGTTGSGKSVAINTMILSLLYKLSPEECRLIMIDPKMLELSVYDGIPHLLSPVVTDPKKAVVALKWVVAEMEERYRKMSKMGVRNIEGYNGRVREALSKGEMFKRTIQTGFDEETGDPVFETEEFEPKAIPFIVVIVDEMADLMMVAGKEIEACIQRLAQMARASGIHLIMATQRPSVDVITGTIKANFPTRISFQVTSKIDSRTILGEQGAEQLLGQGDMLYMAGGAKITRVHGPFVSDEEVEEIVNHLKSFGPPEYMSGVVEGPEEDAASDIDAVLGLNTGGNTDGDDALYDQAVAIVVKDRKCSTSYIQRKLGIGYNKAARLVEQMEDQGVVTPANHVGKREILLPEP